MTATTTWRFDELTIGSSLRELGNESSQADLRARGDSAGRADPPVLAVMIHLLGAVALGAASLVLGALVLLGVVERSATSILAFVLGSSSAVVWLAWLVLLTAGTTRGDEDWRVPADDTGQTTHPAVASDRP